MKKGCYGVDRGNPGMSVSEARDPSTGQIHPGFTKARKAAKKARKSKG